MIFFLFLCLLLFLPISIGALTEEEARKVIVDYANYVYNKKDEITYVSPSDVNQDQIYLGYKTTTVKGKACYGMDCNAFVSFLVYNALQLDADSKGNVASGIMTRNRVALNGADGWSTHSIYYGDGKSYRLNSGETLADASKRYDIKSKLKAGDIIGVIGYKKSSYKIYDSGKNCSEDPDQAGCEKCSHIMLYIGDGKYIHNTGSGVTITSLPSISHGMCVGASFGGGTHGSITVLRFKNFDQINERTKSTYRFPSGNGKLNYINKDGSSGGNSGGNSGGSGGSGGSGYHGGGGNVTSTSRARVCQREDIAKVVKLIVLFIKIIFVAVPIILILSLMINLIQVISKPDEMEKFKKTAVNRIVAAVVIFLVPTLVNIIMGIAGDNSLIKECLKLAENPVSIQEYESNTGSNSDGSSKVTPTENGGTSNDTNTGKVETKELEVKKDGIYITISSKDTAGYYFSNKKIDLKGNESGWISSSKNKIDFILLPGEHYVYSKSKDGKIYEKKVSISVSDIVDTNSAKDISLLNIRLDSFLKSKGSSIDEFNDAIARSVTIAGVNTKEGTSAASLALTQILYKKYKVKIPYGGTNHMKAGARASWGSTNLAEGGIHCGGFVVWSLAQSGIGTNSGIGSSAQITNWRFSTVKRITSSYHGNPGEVITIASQAGESKHVAVLNVAGKNDFWITEANAKTYKDENGKMQIRENYGVVTTHETYASNERWNSILPMERVYDYKEFEKIDVKSGF